MGKPAILCSQFQDIASGRVHGSPSRHERSFRVPSADSHHVKTWDPTPKSTPSTKNVRRGSHQRSSMENRRHSFSAIPETTAAVHGHPLLPQMKVSSQYSHNMYDGAYRVQAQDNLSLDRRGSQASFAASNPNMGPYHHAQFPDRQMHHIDPQKNIYSSAAHQGHIPDGIMAASQQSLHQSMLFMSQDSQHRPVSFQPPSHQASFGSQAPFQGSAPFFPQPNHPNFQGSHVHSTASGAVPGNSRDYHPSLNTGDLNRFNTPHTGAPQSQGGLPGGVLPPQHFQQVPPQTQTEHLPVQIPQPANLFPSQQHQQQQQSEMANNPSQVSQGQMMMMNNAPPPPDMTDCAPGYYLDDETIATRSVFPLAAVQRRYPQLPTNSFLQVQQASSSNKLTHLTSLGPIVKSEQYSSNNNASQVPVRRGSEVAPQQQLSNNTTFGFGPVHLNVTPGPRPGDFNGMPAPNSNKNVHSTLVGHAQMPEKPQMKTNAEAEIANSHYCDPIMNETIIDCAPGYYFDDETIATRDLIAAPPPSAARSTNTNPMPLVRAPSETAMPQNRKSFQPYLNVLSETAPLMIPEESEHPYEEEEEEEPFGPEGYYLDDETIATQEVFPTSAPPPTNTISGGPLARLSQDLNASYSQNLSVLPMPPPVRNSFTQPQQYLSLPPLPAGGTTGKPSCLKGSSNARTDDPLKKKHVNWIDTDIQRVITPPDDLWDFLCEHWIEIWYSPKELEARKNADKQMLRMDKSAQLYEKECQKIQKHLFQVLDSAKEETAAKFALHDDRSVSSVKLECTRITLSKEQLMRCLTPKFRAGLLQGYRGMELNGLYGRRERAEKLVRSVIDHSKGKDHYHTRKMQRRGRRHLSELVAIFSEEATMVDRMFAQVLAFADSFAR